MSSSRVLAQASQKVVAPHLTIREYGICIYIYPQAKSNHLTPLCACAMWDNYLNDSKSGVIISTNVILRHTSIASWRAKQAQQQTL